MFFLEELI